MMDSTLAQLIDKLYQVLNENQQLRKTVSMLEAKIKELNNADGINPSSQA